MKIVFFDGYCTLCNGLVDWLIKRDAQKLKFASLQGQTASQMLGSDEAHRDVNTVIYLDDSSKYERSTAVIMILADLGGAWRILRFALYLPVGLRDSVYNWVATNRHRFFKKRELCRVPTSAERMRILP